MIFFCMVPVYKALEKRWNHWDDLENDPRWNADIFASAAEGVETGSMGSPPAYYSNTPSPQVQPPQVVVQVATPPPAGPVKKTYRKVKKTPVVPKPKPDDL